MRLDLNYFQTRPILALMASVLVLAIAFPGRVAAADAAPPVFAGPFELHQALTFYLVNESGAAFSVHLKWRDENQTQADRPVLIRVFDPQENLILRHEEPCERVSGAVPAHSIDLPVGASGSGVYQVCVTAFGGSMELETSPRMSFGVLGFPRLVGNGKQFENAFVFLPPGLDALAIRCEGAVDSLSLRDESGVKKIDVRGMNPSSRVEIPNGEHVWRFSAISSAPYKLDFGGLPIILCPNERSARAIHSSVDVLADGTICFHKFQIRAHDLLERYRQMPAAAYAVQPPLLQRYRAQWLAEPARNDLLLGPYGVYAALPATLQEQNLNPTSPWFGAIRVWKDQNGNAKTANPLASYSREGLPRLAQHAAVLAAVYSINAPFNPLFKNEALRNRVIIASLQDLMMIQEHELPLAAVPDNYYGGDRAFIFSSFVHSFPLVIRDCPDDVQAVWTEGLRRYVDHETISQVATVVNQWTFLIVGLQHFADGTGESIYDSVVMRHLTWLLTRNQWDCGYMPAGYFFELGPDATYAGIDLHNLGWLYKQLIETTAGRFDAESMKIIAQLHDAIDSCMDLFNHTIAPQPDGSLLGVSSFCTRTPGDWTAPQHGAGFAMLADQFPRATPHLGTWPAIRSLSRIPGQRRIVEDQLIQRLEYLDSNAFADPAIGSDTIAGGPELHFMIWQHFASNPAPGQLPMAAQQEFTRNFGDEFFCVRRPSYYAFIYAGQSLPGWRNSDRPADAHQQFPHNGGGLCMFWSSAFGTSILAKNWSAFTAQTLVAQHNGRDVWEDYWSVQSRFDVEHATASVSGRLLNLPLQFERRYRFLHDRVECELSIHATEQVTLDSLVEVFPFPSDGEGKLRAMLIDAEGRAVGKRPASAIVFRNGSREAHLVVFNSPRTVNVGMEQSIDRYRKARTYGRAIVSLPTAWKPGQTWTCRWSMQAVRAPEIAATVARTIAEMNP